MNHDNKPQDEHIPEVRRELDYLHSQLNRMQGVMNGLIEKLESVRYTTNKSDTEIEQAEPVVVPLAEEIRRCRHTVELFLNDLETIVRTIEL